METSKYGQVTFENEANQAHGSCKCTETSGGGDCSWCQVYYKGPSDSE